MNDIAQTGLREPEQTDWDNYNAGGTKYQTPPPALGPDGKAITYFGVVDAITESEPDDGYLNYQIDIKVVGSGTADGTRVRTWASYKPFQKRDKEGNLVPIPGNPNKLANFLRATGLPAKPNSLSEYRAAVKAAVDRKLRFPFTLDWEAKNRDTGEVVRGFENFPDDPERPGQKKSILRAGDVVTERDSKRQVTGTRTVQSEILFANPRFRYFGDPTKGSK